MTARGRLDRREMVLLRLRSEDGLSGLGEAVPLSLRGGGDAGAGGRRAGAAGRVVGAGRGEPDRRHRQPLRPRPLRGADGADGPAGAAGRRRGTLLGGAGGAGAVQRDPGRGRAGGGRRGRPALGRRRLLDLQAEAGSRRRPSPRCERCATRWDRRHGSGSTPTRPGTWRRQSGRCASSSRSTSSSPSSRWRRAEQMAEVATATSIPLAGDESVESRDDAERAVSLRCLRPGRREALEGRRPGGGDRDRRGAPRPTSPAPSTARSGSPPPHRSRRRCARTPPTMASTWPTGWRPSDSSPRRWPRSSASCTTGCCTHPPGRGSASRSTSGRSTCIGFSLAGRYSRPMRDFVAHRVDPPTPTPPSPPPSSRSWRAAGCGTRSSPPAPARRRWRWRSGASRRSR